MYWLHPAVKAIRLDDARIQLSGPNFNLTLDDPDGDLQSALDGPLDPAADGNDTAVDGNKSVRLASYLKAQGVLVSDEKASSLRASPDDVLITLDFFKRRQEINGTKYAPRASPTGTWSAHVIGIGALADGTASQLARLACDVRRSGIADIRPPGDALSNQEPALAVVCCDREDHHTLREANRALISANMPAIYGCLTSHGVRIGPTVVPGQTACYECFYQRMRNGMHFLDEFDALVNHQHEPGALIGDNERTGLAATLAAVLIALQFTKFGMRIPRDDTAGQVGEMRLCPLEYRTAAILRLPRCGVCGAGRPDREAPAMHDRRIWRTV